MLWLFTSCRGLRFDELMEVYTESNQQKTSDYPDLPAMFALELAERDFRQYLEEVFFRTPDAILAVWEVDAKYVCALRLEPYRDGLLLEGVETAPWARRNGYAETLIQQIQTYLTEQKTVKLYSHVRKGNIPSLKLHEKCGFQKISNNARYIDGSMDSRSYTLLYDTERTPAS